MSASAKPAFSSACFALPATASLAKARMAWPTGLSAPRVRISSNSLFVIRLLIAPNPRRSCCAEFKASTFQDRLERRFCQASSSPTKPRRNATTQTTKITPMITVTHEPTLSAR